MNTEIKHKTLNEITAVYRLKGPAKKGYSVIHKYLNVGDELGLKELLRDHREDPIDDKKVIIHRDNIDYLLEYYSLISLGLIADVLPQNLNEHIRAEVDYILKNSAVKPYYKRYYPLWLPRLLTRQDKKPIIQKIQYDTAYTFFMQALELVSERVRNENIEMFLWFLDDGITEDYDIDDVIDILDDPIKFEAAYKKKYPNEAEMGFRGLINYFAFINEFYDLLNKLNRHKLLQSAVWHLEGYWFREFRKDLNSVLRKSIKIAYKDLNKSSNSNKRRSGEKVIQDFVKKVNKITSTDYAKPLQDALNSKK